VKTIENVVRPENYAKCGASDSTIVTKVIDGDTVVVEGGYHIRLLGMYADETGYPCFNPAKIRLENLILGKMVKLEKDKTDLDQYGRCLRYIFLADTNVDIQLVKEGLAVARFYEPDIKYKTEIAKAEQQAIDGKIGCKWQK
jgi:micrococcal nuclease